MNKQMVNMLELAQPQPATPEQLMDCVRTAWAKADRLAPSAPAPQPAASGAPTMYGAMYAASKATADTKGTGGVKKCVLTLASISFRTQEGQEDIRKRGSPHRH